MNGGAHTDCQLPDDHKGRTLSFQLILFLKFQFLFEVVAKGK